MRHTGAGGFALSSTVQVDVLVFGEPGDFLGKLIGLNSNRAPDSGSAGIVVTVAAYIDEQDLLRFLRLKLFGQFNHLNPWRNAINAVFPVAPQPISDEHDRRQEDRNLHRVPGRLKTTGDDREKIAKQKSNDAIR